MRLPQVKISPFAAGLVMGVGAALVQAFFKVVPPPAYGMCMVCHAKDLGNWIADHLFETGWGYTSASIAAPVLTVVGVLIGSFFAARQHGEFRLKPVRDPFSLFATGFLAMNFGLILGSCPIRIVILTAYGNLLGIVGVACVVLGVWLGTTTIAWHARRAVEGSLAS